MRVMGLLQGEGIAVVDLGEILKVLKILKMCLAGGAMLRF